MYLSLDMRPNFGGVFNEGLEIEVDDALQMLVHFRNRRSDENPTDAVVIRVNVNLLDFRDIRTVRGQEKKDYGGTVTR